MKLLFLVFVFVIITLSAKADVIRKGVKYFESTLIFDKTVPLLK